MPNFMKKFKLQANFELFFFKKEKMKYMEEN